MGCELWPSIIGGLIAGGFAIAAVYWTLRGQRQQDNDRQQEIIQGVLQAIYEELNTIYKELTSSLMEDNWKAFKKIDQEKDIPLAEDNSKELEKPALPPYFLGRLRVPKDYLIVYRSNANFIGQINNSELRSEIVSTYMFLQIVMDEYKTYNEYLIPYLEEGRMEKALPLFISPSEQLQKLSRKLLIDHESLTESIKSFLETLEEEIPL